MKQLVVLLISLVCPLFVSAQDDMYFVPSKKGGADSYSSSTHTVPSTVTYGRQNERDVDEYNRRGSSTEYEDTMAAEYAAADDYSCTERIIRFHSPSVGIYISSPYYWDYYYDDWWWYRSSFYGWGGWWSWGYPYSPYYAFYPYYGWGGYYDYYWGGWHRPHLPVWNPRPSTVGNKVGDWRPGPTGGYVRYGTGYRNSNRYSISGNQASPTRRNYGTIPQRTFSGNRNNNSSGQREPIRSNRTFGQPSNNSNQNRTVVSPSRSYNNTPSRSSAPSRSGGGRSFGGRR